VRVSADEVTEDRVVALAFTLTDAGGETLDEATATEPFVYLHGHGALPASFEAAVAGRELGERFEAELPYRELFESAQDAATRAIPLDAFAPDARPRLGDRLEIEEDGERFEVWVTALHDPHVWVSIDRGDQAVKLVVEVLKIRRATAREVERGEADGLEPAADSGQDESE